jgi:hypothetical protein
MKSNPDRESNANLLNTGDWDEVEPGKWTSGRTAQFHMSLSDQHEQTKNAYRDRMNVQLGNSPYSAGNPRK